MDNALQNFQSATEASLGMANRWMLVELASVVIVCLTALAIVWRITKKK